MANPLPNEKELYVQIKREKIKISPEIWDLLYHRLGDDITAINLLCQYYLTSHEPIPVSEAKKIIIYTRHIKDIVNKITLAKKEDFPFPEFLDDSPLHPILREMFTHHIGNDIYLINLIVGDSIDPLAPQPVSSESTRKILNYVHAIKEFMDKLREATSQQEVFLESTQASGNKVVGPDNIQGQPNKEEILSRIRNLLAQEFKILNEEKIKPESRFNEDFGLDSVDAIRVIMVLEDGFDLEIPDDDTVGVVTVAQAVDYVYRRLEEGSHQR
jgi:acyl carrier protein